MTAFDAAVTVMFADMNMSVTATYEPAGGDAFSLRVMRQAPVGEYGFDDTRISSESVSFLVRRADVAQPASGDRIVCDGQARIVQGVPELDAERLVWTIDTRPA